MEKSKLITILKTLSDSEVKEFGKFLEGTSYRKDGAVFTLFKYLKKQHPELPATKIEKTYVQKAVFKKSTNSYRRLFDVMSQLSLALENYLIVKQLEIHKTEREFLLLEAYKTKKLDKLFFQKIASWEKNWDQEKVPGTEEWLNLYRLRKMEYMHPNKEAVEKVQNDNNTITAQLDKFYIASKLHWEIIESTKAKALKKDIPKQQFIDKIIEISKSSNYKVVPQINLFEKLLNIITTNQIDRYKEIKDDLFENLNSFNQYEAQDVILILQKLCFQHFQSGNLTAMNELFELNCLGVEKKIFIEDGYINIQLFKYIINIACSAEQFEWAEKFIEDYQDYLVEDEKKDLLAICRADISMRQGKFDEALHNLATLKFKNTFYALQARVIQLQCYFELEDYDELFDNMIKSFNVFLTRESVVSSEVKDFFKNFIFYIKKLKKYRDNKTIIPNDFKNQLLNDSSVVGKTWLIKKLNIN